MVNGKPFIAQVDSSYMSLLRRVDARVLQKNLRPYVANIIDLGGFSYAIPFTSKIVPASGIPRLPKFTEIVKDSHNRPIAAMLFNNMIPVPPDCITKMPVGMEGSTFGRDYARFIRTDGKNIQQKAENVYSLREKGNDKICNDLTCDFKTLETICKQYTKGRENNSGKSFGRN